MTVLTRYGEVLRGHGTAVPLVASIVGRLSLGMTTLALILLVRDTTGSYASAGLVAAAYALAFGVFGPARARSADRRGPVRALLLTAAVHPVAMVLLVLLAARGAPPSALALVAVFGGASVPPHGPVMRALWGSLFQGRSLATAYSLESVVVELCFVVGPVLTAVLATNVDPGAAVVVAGLLATTGAVWLTATTSVRAVVPAPQSGGNRFGPLASAAVRALLLTVTAIGVTVGAIEVSLPAYVEREGARPAAAGILLAVWSVGSIVGGLVYGGLHLSTPPRRQVPVLVGALALGTALPLLATGPLVMGLSLFAFGLTLAPFSACNSVLLGEAAPRGTTTEAFAWNTSMLFGGAAVGSALAGVLVERIGPPAGLAVATAAGVLAVGAAVSSAARLPGPEVAP